MSKNRNNNFSGCNSFNFSVWKWVNALVFNTFSITYCDSNKKRWCLWKKQQYFWIISMFNKHSLVQPLYHYSHIFLPNYKVLDCSYHPQERQEGWKETSCWGEETLPRCWFLQLWSAWIWCWSERLSHNPVPCWSKRVDSYPQ